MRNFCLWFLPCYTDINECLTGPCHSQAQCTNTPENFFCTCNIGYTGNGTYCIGNVAFE